HIALWHRRFDLAAPAARRLSRAGLELPDEASRRRFQGVWALCRVLSEAERMRLLAQRGYAAATGRTSSSDA
ncbi:MAG TPA: hypothetical protein VLN26_05970, partial [Gaiellaceae bacterium]|nr:hypothetical protein [Gaiellaceae bacterium]